MLELVNKVREQDGDVQEVALTFKVDGDTVDKYTDEFFKELAQNDIPGFRKGHAPRSVLERGIGGHVAAAGQIAEKIINGLAWHDIDEQGVIFIDQPEFNIESDVIDHQPFTFTVSGKVKPVIELSSYGPVSIEMPPEQATEAEIDQQIQSLREYYYTFETVEGRPVEMGDLVMTVISCSVDGNSIPGLKETSRLVELGGGTMPESFDEHLVGAKVGDTLEFDFDASSDGEHRFVIDGMVHANVEVKEIRVRKLPELNDEFAAKLGATNPEDLRKQVQISINQQKKEQLHDIMQQNCIAALGERVVGEIPEYYLDITRENVQREFVNSLKEQGTDLQNFIINNNMNGDEFKAQVREEAIRQAKEDLALDALFEGGTMELTDEDIAKEFEGAEDPEGTLAMWKDQDRMADLHQICRRSKAVRWLVETAEVTVVDKAAEAAEAK